MKQIFLLEWKRAFFSKGMIFALFVGCVITLSHTVQYIIPAADRLAPILEYRAWIHMPETSFTSWVGGSTYTMQSFLYFMIFPLLVAIPHGASYFDDLKSGYIINICIRVDKKVYLAAKYLVTFICAGIVFIVPLLLNFLTAILMLPSLLPQTLANQTGLTFESFANGMFFTQPWLFLLLFILFDFVYAGLVGTLSLVFAFFVQFKFLVLVAPFVCYIFYDTMASMFGISDRPVYFMNPGANFTSILLFVVSFLVLGALSLGLYLLNGVKADVF